MNVDIFVRGMPAQQLSTECIFLMRRFCVSQWLLVDFVQVCLQFQQSRKRLVLNHWFKKKKKHAGIYLRFLLKIIFFSSSAMLLR